MSTIRETLEIEGNQIHVVEESENDWEVWLDTDAGEYDGLCIGIGQDKDEAIQSAVDTLTQSVAALKRASGKR